MFYAPLYPTPNTVIKGDPCFYIMMEVYITVIFINRIAYRLYCVSITER